MPSKLNSYRRLNFLIPPPLWGMLGGDVFRRVHPPLTPPIKGGGFGALCKFSLLLFTLASTLTGCASALVNQAVDEELPSQVFRLYYPNGQFKSVWQSREGKLHGFKREYTEDGNLQFVTEYQNNVIDMKNTYHLDGKMWSKEIYLKGVLVNNRVFDQEGLLVSEETF